jgi:hypothetical protein
VVSTDISAIEKDHAKRDVVLLDEIAQTLPDALLCPADEQLRCQPPRAKLSRNAAPLRAIPVPPENRRDRPPQFLGRRLAPRPDLLDQRLPNRPRRIRQNLPPILIRHTQNIGTVSKL